jgi:small subunit ribosomal protein S16
MTTIRLTRMGAKKRPFYRIVVVDSRQRRDGEYIECVGYYHPIEKPAKVEINEERLAHYVKCGAKLSETVKNIVKEKGLRLS